MYEDKVTYDMTKFSFEKHNPNLQIYKLRALMVLFGVCVTKIKRRRKVKIIHKKLWLL